MTKDELIKYHAENGFAMSLADLEFVQNYFKGEKRNPTETEIKVIDTYWSDHCRHTTFLTQLTDVKINSENKDILKAFEKYKKLHDELYNG